MEQVEQQNQKKLSQLSKSTGRARKKVRVGRGIGSGKGVTAGRGQKGQTSRSGSSMNPGFEGGQMPLYRRVPKFGFKNPSRKEYQVLNMFHLSSVFSDGDEVTPATLVDKKLVKKSAHLIKILGEGEMTKKLTVRAHKFSKSAIKKINNAGGQIEEIKV